jgi:hypothetical protein
MRSSPPEPFFSLLEYLDHIEQRGCDLCRVACERDLERIVGKWSGGTYRTMAARRPGRRSRIVSTRNHPQLPKVRDWCLACGGTGYAK